MPLTPALKPVLKRVESGDPVQIASDIANRAHIHQKRKVTGLPYIIHPFRVAGLVDMFGGSQDQIAAAWAHDVIEDGDEAAQQEARERLTPAVLKLVLELTKQEVSPGRRVKGELFLAELRRMSDAAALVKLCDRIDNLGDGVKDMPLDWLERYTAESVQLAEILNRRGLESAHDMLQDIIAHARHRIESNA